MGTTIEFIEDKIQETSENIGSYLALANLEWWQQSALDGLQSELENYNNVKNQLEELQNIKNGNLKVV